MALGPITGTILGLVLLAIVISIVVKVAQAWGWLDADLAGKLLWGTGVVIVIILVILIFKMLFGNASGIRLP